MRSSISTTATLPAGGSRSVEAFIAERGDGWAALVELLGRARGRLERLPGPDALRLGELYRSTAADLARARQRWPGDPVVGELEALVGRARTVVYRVPGRRASFGHWLTTGFFRRVRERPVALLVAALLLWGPTIGVAVWANGDPATAARVARISAVTEGAAPDGDLGVSTLESGSLSTQLFVNNIRAAFTSMALGIAGGLPTAVVLAFNGAIVGLLAGLFFSAGLGGTAISLLAPHGCLELSLLTVAGAAGLRLGRAVVAPGLGSRSKAVVTEARAAAELALGVALWLIPTGCVEGFVTPQVLPPAAALAVGLALAGLFWGLVWWRGRPEDGPDTGQSRAPALASR